MFDELNQYLSATQSPEYLIRINRACLLFERLGMNSYQDGLMRAIDLEEVVGVDNTLNNIELSVNDYLFEAIGQFNVVCQDHTPMEVLCAVLEGLMNVEYYGDPQLLSDALNQDGSDEERLALVLGYCSFESPETILLYLDNFSSTLLDVMKANVEQRIEPGEEDPQMEHIRLRLRRYIRQHPNTYVDVCLRKGLVIGSEVSRLLIDQIPYLESLTRQPEVLLTELTGLVLASDTSDDDIRQTVLDEAEGLRDDLSFTTQLSVKINKVLTGVLVDERA